MSLTIKERLERFYLGDNEAWDGILREFFDWAVNLLAGRFRNLPFEEIEDVVDDWFNATCIKVEEARNRAEREAADERLAPAEINRRKIEYGEECVGFKFGQSFEAFLWVVLKRRVLDCLRKKTRRGEIGIEADFDLSDCWEGVSEVEFAVLMGEFKKFLVPTLDEKERLYFHIWEEYGWSLAGKDVGEIFQARFPGSGTSDASVSLVKKGFIRMLYLTFVRIEDNANLLSEKFRRQLGKGENDDKFFDDMMRIIWNVFYKAKEARAMSEGEISPNLWVKWKKLVQKNRVQNEILTESYRFFRARKPRPTFCRLVELYADNPFGGRVRELFFGDGGSKENE